MNDLKTPTSLFKRIVSAVTLICFSSSILVVPSAQAGTTVDIAPSSGISSTWANLSAQPNNWVSMPNSRGYGQNVKWPKLNYTKIAESTWSADRTNENQAAFDWKMIEGERWITNGREELGQAGVPSSQISSRINALPKTSAYVFAAYSPTNAELVIEIQKVEKTPNGQLIVYRADYTPHHGEYNRWKRDYLTPSENADPTKLGYNPFQNFKGATNDNAFHNISWEAVGVAVGMAMRASDAHIGYIASDKSRFTQKVKKSGGMLKKKVKVTVQGFVKPQWFIATPLEVQPEGGMSSICAVNSGAATGHGNTSSCDSPYHLVTSGVSIMSWAGGNMPETEELLYNYVYKKSSFTVLAFTILTFALTWGLASAFAAVVGPASAASTAAIGSAAGSGIGSATIGAIGAGIYAGTAVLAGADIVDAQAGWAGSTGNGVMKPNTSAQSRHESGLNQGIKNKQITSRVGTGLAGYQSLYKGDCPETMAGKDCIAAGLDTGSMHRTDSYLESNVVRQLREAEVRCKAKGLTGKALAICTAPKAGAWTISTGL
ncbi:hypothetical protein [Methylotenera versatilis]|uniref:hypothetical protein n=1 Tax=Methylotenera versatilis TaxID=1055487 RepID=UPI0006477C5E|nr:hypothetical protein [Methylotenera versatilis]